MRTREWPARRVRAGAAAGLSLVLAGGVSAVSAAPALAAPLGTVAISSQSGDVTSNPIFAKATTSAPCPAGYGENASLRVGPPNGPFTNLAKPLTDGGYDKAKVTFSPNRSYQLALGSNPADGVWWIVVECFSATAGRHPERFVTPITVSGTGWRVGASGQPAQPGSPDESATQTPTPSASPTATVDPTPAGSAEPNPATSMAEPTPAAHRLPASGASLVIAAIVTGGVLLAGSLVSLLVVRRRRVAPALPKVAWPEESVTEPPTEPPSDSAKTASSSSRTTTPTAKRK
ncbi:hypothetical protein [Micromonospora narathiwatensis]|uniref:LPXTG-motif cell wall anchor domain-containing protein n=1 Tax=Micromonospora narathiwatensis TaxID=299146 RepID=A0A1A9ACL4_9ACTN|nr:hypothetical protein [Micromonospora narathiwatensis]SBT53902.1 hypothetical protein GA0070621_5060 [Micromonospora narathiwatensis]